MLMCSFQVRVRELLTYALCWDELRKWRNKKGPCTPPRVMSLVWRTAQTLGSFFLVTLIYLCVGAHVCGCVHAMSWQEIRGQCTGISSLLPPNESRAQNSGCPTWWHVPLLTKPSLLSHTGTHLLLFFKDLCLARYGGVVANTFNPSTLEAEAGGSL